MGHRVRDELLRRVATRSDLDALAELERASFPNPWTAKSLEEELNRECAIVEVVHDPGGCLVGMSCAWRIRDETHLLRISVRPSHRRQGVGAALLSAVLARAADAKSDLVALEVGSKNVGALALYRTHGFEVVGVRKNYYRTPPDDAVCMILRIQRTRVDPSTLR